MSAHSHKAIGVLDSGVGGLTVVREIQRQLPHEGIVYFGDTARMPYGPRPYEEVRRFALEIIDFLISQEIKMVVVACNSATAAGITHYQKQCPFPVLGVIEPGVRAAIAHTRNNKVGVIGTTGTINSSAYKKALLREKADLQVVDRACPLFVLLVENNLVDTREALLVAEEYLQPFKKAGVDTLILGCTHYPLMAGLIQQVVGPGVKLISSAEETAAEVKAILTATNLHNPLRSSNPGYRFFVSGSPKPFEEIGTKLLRQPVKAYQVLLNN
ncbi:MAG TPA: glutamate racemase [Bacillota bacterium]|nr:glutamate racemase [Bacillota bacterium]